jgi:YYY domain-containing protein
MPEAFIWWLAIELVGLAAFPLAFRFFRFCPDRGYAFSKVFGLTFLSYTLWIGGSIHLFTNSRGTIIALLALMFLASLFVVAIDRIQIASFLRSQADYVIFTEALFTGAFAFAALLISYTPEITFGEKVADFSFINGILRSDYFPPHDPWLSGESINWYYFGHLNVATLTKLVGIPSKITFSLAKALIAALAATGAFGLVYNLIVGRGTVRRAFGFGLVAALFLLVLSNMEGMFELMAAHGIGSSRFYGLLGVYGLEGPVHSSKWFPTEWWWIGRAVQIAYRDLREFPFFSFLSGDLHAHWMAIPFNLLALALLLDLWRSDYSLNGRFWRLHPLRLVVTAVVIGAIGFVELWDFPAFLFLLMVLALGWNFLREGRLNLAVVRRAVGFALPVSLIAVVAFLPFYLGLHPVSEGVQPLEAVYTTPWAPLETTITQPHHFIYAWLPFTWLALAFFVVSIARWRLSLSRVSLAMVPALLPLAIWSVLVLGRRGLSGFGEEIATRAAGWVTMLMLVSLLTLATLAYIRRAVDDEVQEDRKSLLFALAMSGTAFLLLLGIELFWVQDPYGTRFNTLFRLGYQAWIFLSIGTAFGLHYILSSWRVGSALSLVRRVGWGMATLLILLAALVYPVPATLWRTNEFHNSRTLDGLALSNHFNPDEGKAIDWLGENVKGSAVVLEAVGDDYNADQGRVSARTGLPTILSWPGHEYTWRGSKRPLEGRAEAVEKIYKTLDIGEAKATLEDFNVEYVYVGRFERDKYGEQGLSKFEQFMTVVFQNDAVTIYQMSHEAEPSIRAP